MKAKMNGSSELFIMNSRDPPQPAGAWVGVRTATDDANVCIQVGLFLNRGQTEGSEDCLYLNVYTPKLPDSGDQFSQANYPVMVWIHGGGWVEGGSSSFHPQFLLDQGIVLVTLNYRLGPLGFLSTSDEVITGNMGLKDQAQALRWTRENIAAFGGDPNSITIFGQSAGGASVHYLLLSPLSKGLFHRAISQSGTSLCPWALSTPAMPKRQAIRLGKELNCPTESSEALVKCLRTKDAADIVVAPQKWVVFNQDPLVPFKPSIEVDHPGAFITQDSVTALTTGRVVDIPWMTGFTSEEGCVRSAAFYGSPGGKEVQRLDKEFLRLAPITMLYELTCSKELQDQVSKKLREFYFGNKPIDESTRTKVTDMYGDAFLTVGIDEAVRQHLRTLASPVYYYYLSYKSKNSWATVFGDSSREYGTCHSDDLFYLFPLHEVIPPKNSLSADDEKMIDLITTLWYNFARTGNPTPDITPELPVKWKPVRTEALEYLEIESPQEIKMSENLLKERIQFWKNLPCFAGRAPAQKPSYIKDEL